MKKLLLAALTLASAGAMAQPQQQATQQQREQSAPQQPMDIYSFCYVENRAYSEGFQLNNMVCSRSDRGPTKTLPGGSQVYPLVWREKAGFYK